MKLKILIWEILVNVGMFYIIFFEYLIAKNANPRVSLWKDNFREQDVNIADFCFFSLDLLNLRLSMIIDAGVSFLAGIMETIKPTDIVQIMRRKSFNNSRSITLTPSFFKLRELKLDGGERWKPRLHILPSLVERTYSR